MKIKFIHIAALLLFISFASKAQEITTKTTFWSEKHFQSGTQLNKTDIKKLMSQNEETKILWRKHKNRETIAYVSLGASLVSSGIAFSKMDTYIISNKSTLLFLTPSMASLLGAIGFAISSEINKKKALKKFNSNINSQSLHLKPTQNGFGVLYNF